uniref:Mid2 domain-containing protein n=1 Tax=Steinernema glaseri TaxID=37863 RepID=A0A1I7Y7V9_9BILA
MHPFGLLVLVALGSSTAASLLLFVPSVHFATVKKCSDVGALSIKEQTVPIEHCFVEGDGLTIYTTLYPFKIDSESEKVVLTTTVAGTIHNGTFVVGEVGKEVKGYPVTLETSETSSSTATTGAPTAKPTAASTTAAHTIVTTPKKQSTPGGKRKKRQNLASTFSITVSAQLKEGPETPAKSGGGGGNTAAVVIAVLEGLLILGIIGCVVYVVFIRNRTTQPSRFSNTTVPSAQYPRSQELPPATRIGQAQPPPPEAPQRGWSRQPLQAVPPTVGNPFDAWEMEPRTNGAAPPTAMPPIPPRSGPPPNPPRPTNYVDDYEEDF